MRSGLIKIIGVSFLVVLIASSSSCNYIFQKIEDRSHVKNDLKNLCDSFPTPKGLRKYDEGGIFKPDRGSFTNTFKTDLDCRSATEPYLKYLKASGWSLFENTSNRFYKGNYAVRISCLPTSPFSSEEKIGVNCSWDRNGDIVRREK